MVSSGLGCAQGKQRLFSFCVIADVQYADISDRFSVTGDPRFYRHRVRVVQQAVKNWNSQQNLRFVINFGDIVDGKSHHDRSLDAVKMVVSEFEKFNGTLYHTIGNHCLSNLPRDKLLPLLKISSVDGHAYYDFSPVLEYRVIVLDGYDISAIGWPKEHPKTTQALEFLESKNPNSEKK